jgi:hypothetical protein
MVWVTVSSGPGSRGLGGSFSLFSVETGVSVSVSVSLLWVAIGVSVSVSVGGFHPLMPHLSSCPSLLTKNLHTLQTLFRFCHALQAFRGSIF